MHCQCSVHRIHGDAISFDDRNTEEVFGKVIDTYDLTRAVDDGATVPVYFEPG